MYDCIIVGAGPAGLMASIALKGRKVLILEKMDKALKKLMITGGGRCNITNLKNNQDFLNEVNYNKKYLYSTINQFGSYEVYAFFESRGVPLKEEEENKVFPVSNKARDIANVLLNDTEAEIHYQEEVLEVMPNKVVTNKREYETKNIIIATGGASFPNTGSSGDHMKFAHALNQPTIDLFPAEVGVILEHENNLAGTAIEKVQISYLDYQSEGNLMFTHKGLSGSAIMKLSEHIYHNEEKEIYIDLVPELNFEDLQHKLINYDREKEVNDFFHELFTKRFSNYLINRLNLNKKIKSLTKNEMISIINTLKQLVFPIKRVESLDKAYVTGGGIALNSINTSTMESKLHPGIYFVGEALDIHGPIGGYNITLALSTGYLAGSKINVSL